MMPVKPSGDWLRRRLPAIVVALCLGALGGWAAALIGLPLPWMMGSMMATTVAAMAGAPIAMAAPLRTVMIAVLGVMLGSGFTPEIIQVLGLWAASLSAIAFYIIVSTAAGYVFFRRYCDYDPVTAYFAATPGGLNEMVLMGTEYGGDGRIISLVHAARILLVVMTVPFAFRWLAEFEPLARSVPGPALADSRTLDLLILAACGLIGFHAARLLKVPAAAIVGPMGLSAIVHLVGLTTAAPPFELVAAAQVAVGAAIGARFAGTAVGLILRTALQAAGGTLILMAITLAFALSLHLLLDFEVDALVLAFAPGGLAEMSLIAIALGANPAFVAIHHIVRIFLIVVLAAPFYRLAGPRRGPERGRR